MIKIVQNNTQIFNVTKTNRIQESLKVKHENFRY